VKAEIIAVGTELLLGQIVNTNAQYLSQGLAALGIDVYFQTVVGDNAGRIRQAIETARRRADLLLFTGGLGPTQDDLTKDVLADYLGRKLVLHEPSMRKIEARLAGRAVMIESNRRQALMIEGSEPLPNETGLAVGNALTADGTHYVLLPGPPGEMRPMFDGPATEWLLRQLGESRPLYSMTLRFAGIGESALEDLLIDLIGRQTDPTIAPYAKEGEVAIRLSTKAADEAEAASRLGETASAIERLAGQYLYAREDVPLEQTVVGLLRASGKTVAVAESCTGGLLAELLTSVPGSSEAFAGGVVVYTNALKRDLLGVPAELFEGPDAPGAISGETAVAMAVRTLERLGGDYAVAITGVAGPSPSEGKPPGLVYVAVAERGGRAAVHELKLSGGRAGIRLRAAKHALYRLWERLNGNVKNS
jgi:nicotinamide-nucleotide amidase